MTYDEMNNFILNYITNDITGRAIMLTGEWGSGKSYYIKNTLKPFLESKANGKHKCVIISLYGISDTTEISKSIYMELRTIKKLSSFKAARTTKAVGKIVSKTVFNSLASKIGFDIGSIKDKDLQQIYESIDLTNVLVVLEDIERTQINIIELLGYINNMCENDGVKVMLVANESELLTTYKKSGDNGKIIEKHTDNALAYLKTKEKAVGDTIYYKCNHEETIKTIIHSFNNNFLSKFENDKCIEDILCIMTATDCYNLRTFIFACQKTSDIFNKIQKEDMNFNKTIFYSIIAFSAKIKYGTIPKWQGNDLVSTDLGIRNYPLYRFCYNYIRWQELDLNKVEITLREHKKMVLLDENSSFSDSDLDIIYHYFEHTEQEVMDTLKRVERRLNDLESIPFYEYRKLAFHLISFHTVLGYDYSSCKSKMIRNISGKSFDINEELMFSPISDFDNDAEKNQYKAFINELKEALKHSASDIFSYSPEDLNVFLNQLHANKGNYIQNHVFISKFNIEKLADMIFRCSPSQLEEFRAIMTLVYRNANSHEFLEDDIDAMKSLKNKVNEKIANCGENTDRIVLQQFRWIVENIDMFIENLLKK